MTAPRLAMDLAQPAPPPLGVGPEPHQSFERLYETHFSFVWRSARRLGTLPSNLDDVVQEIFVVVHRQLGGFEGRSSIKTWLFGIVANVVRAHRRALRLKHPQGLERHVRSDSEAVADGGLGPHERAMRAEAACVVDRLLDALDEDKRAVFVLAELEEMSAPEIAAALRIPLNTVYSRLRLARHEFAEAAARHRAHDEWRTR